MIFKMLNLDTLLHSVQHYKLFPPNCTAIVAVSGGKDSICLLHWLKTNQEILQIKLHVATLDHGIRGDAGKLDTEFVAALCQEWGITCTVGSVNVPQIAQDRKESLEQVARNERYKFLYDTLKNQNAQFVLTAHHRDDQAETVLMRFINGTSPHGLQGMQQLSDIPIVEARGKNQLLRPFLYISRNMIDEYAQAHQIPFHYDETNDDATYKRNQIRREVLPYLRQLNPQVDDALLRLSDVAQLEQHYLKSKFDSDVLPHIQLHDHHVIVDKYIFQSWHKVMQSRALIAGLRHLLPEMRIAKIHLDDALKLIDANQLNSQSSFPQDYVVRVTRKYVVIYHKTKSDLLIESQLILEPNTIYSIIIGKTTYTSNFNLTLSHVPIQSDLSQIVYLSSEKKNILRTRRSGDKFAPLSLKGQHQSLKKWFNLAKIPVQVRNVTPILTLGNQVIAIILEDKIHVSHDFSNPEPVLKQLYINIQIPKSQW